LGANVITLAVLDIFQSTMTLICDPSRSSKVKCDGVKLGAGLQQVLPHHPAKFQPDHANGLRDVHYQIFHFLTLGAKAKVQHTKVDHFAKFHCCAWSRAGDIQSLAHQGQPFCQISLLCMKPCRRYPLQTNKESNRQRNSKWYVCRQAGLTNWQSVDDYPLFVKSDASWSTQLSEMVDCW